ncbi:MAG: ABC transporter substrate-binding protein [Betaproteobacteria bacterium]|nr:ABC transporter substrate-binding protein [Betaproteobacteria bacterium]
MNIMGKGLVCAALLAAAQTAAFAEDRVRAAVGQRGNWDTLFISQGIAAGIFKHAGIEVDITWTRGGAETLQAIITDSADLAMANGMLGVIGAISKGAPVRIVSAQMTGAPDIYWYVRSDSPAKTMKDMNGLTMGYSRPGSSTDLVGHALAEHFGVKPKFVSTGGIPDTRTQVMSRQIDAGWAAAPFNFELLNDGKIRILARGSEVPGLADQTVRVNAASLKFLNEKRDLARRFMKAYHESIEWVYANPEKASAFYAEFNKVSPRIAKQTVEFFPKAAVAAWPVRGLKKNLDEALQHKQLAAPLGEAEAQKLLYDFVYQPQ